MSDAMTAERRLSRSRNVLVVGDSTAPVLLGVLLWSIVASIGYLANLAGPPAIGLLADRVGLLRSFWPVVVLMLAAFAAAGALTAPRTTTASIDERSTA